MSSSSCRAVAALSALLAFAPAGRLAAQPAFVASHGTLCVTFPGTTGGTYNMPILSTVPVGHTLVLTLGVVGSAAGSGMSDTQANTWSFLGGTLLGTPTAFLQGTTVTHQLTTADHITVSFSSNSSGSTFALTLAEYSGIGSLPGSIDQSNYATGTGTSPGTTLGGPTSQASEILVGTTTAGAPPGLTSILNYATASAAGCTTYQTTQDYWVVSSIGTYGYNWTFGNSVPWGVALAALKAGTVPVGLARFDAE